MKRVVKSVMANLFCGILILGICGCGGGAQQSTDVQASEESAVGTSASAEKTVRISVASATEINMPDYISCKDGSTLEILKYPDSMLGSDHDMIQGCQAGTISVFIGSATVSIDTVPELALLSVPYLMNDYDQYQEVLQSTWKAMNQEEYEALTPAQQEALVQYAEKSIVYEDSIEKCIEKYGLEVSKPDEDLLEMLQEGRQGVIDNLRRSLGAELVEDFLSTTTP